MGLQRANLHWVNSLDAASCSLVDHIDDLTDGYVLCDIFGTLQRWRPRDAIMSAEDCVLHGARPCCRWCSGDAATINAMLTFLRTNFVETPAQQRSSVLRARESPDRPHARPAEVERRRTPLREMKQPLRQPNKDPNSRSWSWTESAQRRRCCWQRRAPATTAARAYQQPHQANSSAQALAALRQLLGLEGRHLLVTDALLAGDERAAWSLLHDLRRAAAAATRTPAAAAAAATSASIPAARASAAAGPGASAVAPPVAGRQRVARATAAAAPRAALSAAVRDSPQNGAQGARDAGGALLRGRQVLWVAEAKGRNGSSVAATAGALQARRAEAAARDDGTGGGQRQRGVVWQDNAAQQRENVSNNASAGGKGAVAASARQKKSARRPIPQPPQQAPAPPTPRSRNPPAAPPLGRPFSPPAAAAVAAAAAFAAAPPITAQQRRAVRQWLHDAFHVSLLTPLSTDASGGGSSGGGGGGGSRGGPAADALRNGCLLCALACLSARAAPAASSSGSGSRPNRNGTTNERQPELVFSTARVRWRPLSAADCRHNLALALGHFSAAAAAPPETPFLAPLLHLGGALVPPLLRGDAGVCWGVLWGLYQGGLRAADRWGLGVGLGANPSEGGGGAGGGGRIALLRLPADLRGALGDGACGVKWAYDGGPKRMQTLESALLQWLLGAGSNAQDARHGTFVGTTLSDGRGGESGPALAAGILDAYVGAGVTPPCLFALEPFLSDGTLLCDIVAQARNKPIRGVHSICVNQDLARMGNISKAVAALREWRAQDAWRLFHAQHDSTTAALSDTPDLYRIRHQRHSRPTAAPNPSLQHQADVFLHQDNQRAADVPPPPPAVRSPKSRQPRSALSNAAAARVGAVDDDKARPDLSRSASMEALLSQASGHGQPRISRRRAEDVDAAGGQVQQVPIGVLDSYFSDAPAQHFKAAAAHSTSSAAQQPRTPAQRFSSIMDDSTDLFPSWYTGDGALERRGNSIGSSGGSDNSEGGSAGRKRARRSSAGWEVPAQRPLPLPPQDLLPLKPSPLPLQHHNHQHRPLQQHHHQERPLPLPLPPSPPPLGPPYVPWNTLSWDGSGGKHRWTHDTATACDDSTPSFEVDSAAKPDIYCRPVGAKRGWRLSTAAGSSDSAHLDRSGGGGSGEWRRGRFNAFDDLSPRPLPSPPRSELAIIICDLTRYHILHLRPWLHCTQQHYSTPQQMPVDGDNQQCEPQWPPSIEKDDEDDYPLVDLPRPVCQQQATSAFAHDVQCPSALQVDAAAAWLQAVGLPLQHPHDLTEGPVRVFTDGILLARLCAKFSALGQVPVGVEMRPKTRAHRLQNVRRSLAWLVDAKRLPVTARSEEDAVLQGEPSVIVALLLQLKKTCSQSNLPK
ncbi:hypothetical protein JKP88DRAFT_254547 [Tribonema minus]|uniref:Calponin-homology (CH) domain-containing protein n=1 Tax=Tribonema minus TaxID=303371 RepID=A0A835Z4A4_9STRA|nr:hypothetical protein JKP88DRAFT_254547 [Tribonema minus]